MVAVEITIICSKEMASDATVSKEGNIGKLKFVKRRLAWLSHSLVTLSSFLVGFSLSPFFFLNLTPRIDLACFV